MNDRISTAAAAAIVQVALPLADRRIDASQKPYAGSPALIPHQASRRWGFTHFGVFVPRLPDPHRYLNTMTLIGATGTELFDNDGFVVEPDARRTTTRLSSTAHGDQYHYQRYDARRDCDLAADGSKLAWGQDLEIEVALPKVAVRGRYSTFSVDLNLEVTDNVAYFTKSPVYDHLSLLAPYTGTITDDAGATSVEGLGTFEYCRAMTPQNFSASPLPPRLKLPSDYFTYQILQLDDVTQVLLTEVQARGQSACLMAHLRTAYGDRQVFDDIEFEVIEWGRDQVDPWGRGMPVPQRLRWLVRDSQGHEVLVIDGEVDAPWRFGHGRGYVGAYHYTGTFRAASIADTGYIEWIDLRRKQSRS